MALAAIVATFFTVSVSSLDMNIIIPWILQTPGQDMVLNYVMLPLIVAGLGIISAVIGTMVVILGKGKNIYGALRNSLFIATFFTAVFAGTATWLLLNRLEPFYAMLAGLIGGIIIGLSTEYYTSEKRKPAQGITEASKTGPATVIIQGMQVGMITSQSRLNWPNSPRACGH